LTDKSVVPPIIELPPILIDKLDNGSGTVKEVDVVEYAKIPPVLVGISNEPTTVSEYVPALGIV
jgi:hypothetical protein